MSGKDWTVEEKGEGGFIELTPNGFLLLSWWALKEHLIRKLDFRTLWGCTELVKRHTDGKTAKYSLKELGLIVRCGSPDDLRDSVTRLCRFGFLSWSESAVSVTTRIADLNHTALAKKAPDLIRRLKRYQTLVNTVDKSRRNVKIRVPRRAIRYIAGDAKTSVIAVMLGCFIRCLFVDKRTNEIRPRGCCRLDWLQEVFGFCLKSLKAARKELLAMEWLTDLDDNEWVSVNLFWNGGTVTTSDEELDTETVSDTPGDFSPDKFSRENPQIPDKSSAPSIYIKHHPLQELKEENQHPASSGPVDGALQQKNKKQGTRRFWVEDGDLTCIKRLLVLFAIAQELKWVGQGEMEFLEFVALAERARTYGTANKGGMFYRLIRNRNYRAFLTLEQEDRARALIAEYREKRAQRLQAKPVNRAGLTLSQDAKIVIAVTDTLTRAGIVDVFAELSRHQPDWTPERWDRTNVEIEQFRMAKKQQELGTRAADVSVLQQYCTDEAA